MRIQLKSLAASALCLMAFGAASANASTLLGDSVDVTLTGDIELQDLGVVVGAGVELQGGDAGTNWGAFLFPTEFIDIGADTISMAFDTSLGDMAELVFSDLDFGSGIANVTLVSTIPEITAANLFFTSDSITLANLDDWFNAGTAGTIDLTISAVPLPAAIWLFGAALGGLGFMRRRA